MRSDRFIAHIHINETQKTEAQVSKRWLLNRRAKVCDGAGAEQVIRLDINRVVVALRWVNERT